MTAAALLLQQLQQQQSTIIRRHRRRFLRSWSTRGRQRSELVIRAVVLVTAVMMSEFQRLNPVVAALMMVQTSWMSANVVNPNSYSTTMLTAWQQTSYGCNNYNRYNRHLRLQLQPLSSPRIQQQKQQYQHQHASDPGKRLPLQRKRTMMTMTITMTTTTTATRSRRVGRIDYRRLPSCMTAQRLEQHEVDDYDDDDGGKREGDGDTDDMNDDKPRNQRWLLPTQQLMMSWSLAASYFTVMAAKCALPSVLSLLMDPSTGGLKFGIIDSAMIPSQPHHAMMARLLAASTLAIAAGKLVLGPVIDRAGGLRSLQAALLLLMTLLGVIAFGSGTFAQFAACWIGVDFVFSSCWAACLRSIHQVFSPTEWAGQIGLLASAARLGNTAAFALFGALLQQQQQRYVVTSVPAARGNMWLSRWRSWNQHPSSTWRSIFALSAALQLIPIVMLRYSIMTWYRPKRTHNNNSNKAMSLDRPSHGHTGLAKTTTTSRSFQSTFRDLRHHARTADFWLHLISRSMLMIVASFLLFVPALMKEVHLVSPAVAAQTASLYAAGCWLSVTVLSKRYNQLPVHRQRWLLTLSLLVGSTGSSVAQLGHVQQWWHLSTLASVISMFAWGVSFAIPFYLPPALYALTTGGVESSATIADVMDLGGFILLAAFNGHVAGILQSSHGVSVTAASATATAQTMAAWIPTFQITTACSLISYLALLLTTIKMRTR